MVICKLPILLAERKMRVADLIRGTGINKTTLHKLYNGELTRIDLETIDRICDYLDVQVGDLFVFEKDKIHHRPVFVILTIMKLATDKFKSHGYEITV